MNSRGEGPEVWANGLDPSTALTVGEAARLAGVSEATLRKRIQSGRLLHEVGRRGGRDIQLVRLVDLAEVYPELAGEQAGSRTDPALGREPAAGEERVAGSGADASPAAAAVPDDGPGRAARQHAFEVRLASLQVGNDGLGAQVRELQVQRADLKSQCNDLRTRLTFVERERQAGTAGLLLAQRRMLELDAAGTVVPWGPAWWRHSRTWGLAVMLLLVGGTLGLEIHESRTARAAAREDASELDGRLVDLAGELDLVQQSGLRVLDEWASERQAWHAERETLELRSAAGEERAGELTATLQSERDAGLEDRRLLEESLAEARALTGSIRVELTREREESRADRRRAAELLDQRERAAAELLHERERVAAELLDGRERIAAAERASTARALADLGRFAQASAEAAEALAGELAQRRIDEQQRTALLLEEIERLGTRWVLPQSAVKDRVPDWDDPQGERARRWLFGLHLPGMFQAPGEGGR